MCPVWLAPIQRFFYSGGALLPRPTSPRRPPSVAQRLLAAYGPPPLPPLPALSSDAAPPPEDWGNTIPAGWLTFPNERYGRWSESRVLFIVLALFHENTEFLRLATGRQVLKGLVHEDYNACGSSKMPSSARRCCMLSGQWGLIFRVRDHKSRPPAPLRVFRCGEAKSQEVKKPSYSGSGVS